MKSTRYGTFEKGRQARQAFASTKNYRVENGPERITNLRT
jgi:hypothetical protein